MLLDAKSLLKQNTYRRHGDLRELGYFLEQWPFLCYERLYALFVWTSSCKHLQLVCLSAFNVNTGARRIMRIDELSIMVRRSRNSEDNASSASFYTKGA